MNDLVNLKSVGALLLNALFVISAYGKIVGFKGTVGSLKSMFWIKNLPEWFFQFTIFMVIVLLLVGPGVIMYSFYDRTFSEYAKYAWLESPCSGSTLWTFRNDAVIAQAWREYKHQA